MPTNWTNRDHREISGQVVTTVKQKPSAPPRPDPPPAPPPPPYFISAVIIVVGEGNVHFALSMANSSHLEVPICRRIEQSYWRRAWGRARRKQNNTEKYYMMVNQLIIDINLNLEVKYTGYCRFPLSYGSRINSLPSLMGLCLPPSKCWRVVKPRMDWVWLKRRRLPITVVGPSYGGSFTHMLLIIWPRMSILKSGELLKSWPNYGLSR